MKSGFVDKIVVFLKPRLKRAGVAIDKLFRKCFKTGRKVVKVLKQKSETGIKKIKKWLQTRQEERLGELANEVDEVTKPELESGAKDSLAVSQPLNSESVSLVGRTEKQAQIYTPKSVEDFIHLIQRTPKNVLSKADRARIAAVMSFNGRRVKDLMAPRTKMIFVREVDLLGPIMLDKLYKSGLTSFPVVDNYRRLKGVLHTEALNALEIKETDRASKYMEKAIYYLYDNDSLMQAIEKMKRTNCYYFFVVDTEEHLAGFLTVEMILDYFLGK